jgi:hypothetical protein
VIFTGGEIRRRRHRHSEPHRTLVYTENPSRVKTVLGFGNDTAE